MFHYHKGKKKCLKLKKYSKKNNKKLIQNIIKKYQFLYPEQLEAILNALLVDITFVDKDDRVRYFNQAKDRIFPRTKAVIGREVQNCHPKKSLHAVTRILEDFRAGRRDSARFWIDMEGRLIHIQYFPVRGPEGEYLGCLEVTQDITDVKGIEGEKRLL